MRKTEIAVIGGGPAGLMAALAAAEMGAEVTLVDKNNNLGGQLVKQTHMFFGSEKEHASTRGIDIGKLLAKEAQNHSKIKIMNNSEVIGYYPDDGVIGIEVEEEKFVKLNEQNHHSNRRIRKIPTICKQRPTRNIRVGAVQT